MLVLNVSNAGLIFIQDFYALLQWHYVILSCKSKLSVSLTALQLKDAYHIR